MSTELRGWSIKTSDLGASIWQILHTFNVFMLEDKIQNPCKCLFQISLRGDGSKKWRWSIQWTILNHRAQFRVKLISRILRCWMRGLRLLWTRSSRIPASRKGQSGGTESSERRLVPSRKTDRVHDLRLLPGYWCSWHSIGLCCFFLHDDDVQDFDTTWDEILLSMTQTPPDRKFVQIENTWVWSTQNRIGIVWNGNSSEDVDARLSKIENDGEEKHKSKTQTAKLWRPKWKNWNREWLRVAGVKKGVERGQGDCCQWKAKGQCSTGDKRSFQHDEDKRAKLAPKTLHPLNHQHKEVEVRRGKRTSEAGVHLKSSLDSRAKITWKVFAPNHLVIIGILSNVNSIKTESGSKGGDACSFAHRQVEDQPSKKKENGWWQKSAVVILKDALQLGCAFSGQRAAGIFTDFTEEHKSLGINSSSSIHKSYAASCKHPKNKGPSLGKIQVKVPHQRSPCALKFEDRSQGRRLKDKSDAPAETRG